MFFRIVRSYNKGEKISFLHAARNRVFQFFFINTEQNKIKKKTSTINFVGIVM